MAVDPIDPIARHAELIGRVTIAWNDVQRLIYMLFEHFSGLYGEKAIAILSAVRSDSNQREIVLALGRIAMRDHPDLVERLKDAINSLNRLSSERNAAIHTSWAINLHTQRIEVAETMPTHKALKSDFESQFKNLLEQLSGQFFLTSQSLH